MENRSQIALFFAAVVLIFLATGLQESVFNNFLDDVYGIGAGERGWLEFPRELPGLLVVMMTGVLATVTITRLGIIGAGVYALGLAGLALFGAPGGYLPMLAMMVLASAGMHLLQPVRASLAIALADETTRGKRMGQLGAVQNLGAIAGAGVIFLWFRGEGAPYRMAFVAAAGVALAGALVYAGMRVQRMERPRTRVLIRKRYSLYYFLELLFGARKQIFITFGPWVLIKAHGHEASDIARLLLIASASGLVFKPLSGLAIDRFGERMVLVADGVILAAVCIGYGYAGFFTASAEGAAALAGACFIADNLLFSLGAGRSIYVSRLTVDREELTATLAMGVSVNHIVSMLLPAAAGLIWVSLGYEAVFLGAAVLALGIAFAATFVPRKAAARDGSIAHEDRSPIDAYWRRYADAFSVMRSALRAPAGVSRRPPRRDEGSDS